MLAYSAAVYQNCGNYKSFGDTKFVPELSFEKFQTVVKASANYQNYSDVIQNILDRTEKELFTETEPYHQIGFSDKGGSTSYYSGDVTEA